MTTEVDTAPEGTGPVLKRRLSRGRRVFYLGFIGYAAVLIYFFAVRGAVPFKVPSGSMEPTLLPGDFLFTTKEPTCRRGDIVVLRDPMTPGGYLVKRIVGMPGDTIGIDNGSVFINGKYASEPYIREPINYVFPPHKVPPGEVLVLGDNRNESDDASRWLIDPETGQAKETDDTTTDAVAGKHWKRTVPLDSVIGTVRLIYLPFSRMGRVMPYPLTNTAGE